jgi:hypothetical protein
MKKKASMSERRALFAILLFMLALTSSAQTDDGPVDPLLGGYDIGVSDEIVLLWADFTGQSGGYFHQKLYDYASINNPDATNEILVKGKDSISAPMPAQNMLDAFSEDIDGDGFDEVVSCWSGEGEHPIRLVIRQVDTTSYEFIDAGVIHVLEEAETIASKTLVRLLPGNFDRDAEYEFILAYLDMDSTIRILLYDTDGTLLPKRKAQLTDDAIYRGNNSFINYDISTGDFDGDGMDEIAVSGGNRKQIFEPEYLKKEIIKEAMFLNLYDVKKDVDYQFQAGASESEIDLLSYLIKDNRLNFRLQGLRLSSADMDNNSVDEMVLGYQLVEGDSIYYLLRHFNTNIALDSLLYHAEEVSVHTKFHKEDAGGGGSMSLTSGDLTGDGLEEVVFAAWDRLKVYNAHSELRFNQLAEFGGLNTSLFANDQNNRTVVITDLDASLSQEEWHREVVVVDKAELGEFGETAVNLFVYEARMSPANELKLSSRAAFTDRLPRLENNSPVAIVCGNFEGDGLRIGTPRKYRETGVFQPLVVVNAPPVHFDIINGQVFDVSNCFSGAACEFIATYAEGVSVTDQISTQVNSDWGLEKKLYTENELAGIKLNAHLTRTYGGKFSKVKNSSSSFAVSVEVQAVHDDMIYATVGDYTIWEYPVYNDGVFQGYMSTVVPELVENRWFPSKSWSGSKYMSNHEAGNILSYPEIDNIQEITSEYETIKNLSSNSYGLGPSTTYKWSLAFSDFTENKASLSNKVGIEMGRDVGIGTEGSTEVSAAPFGIGGSVSIDYKISVGKSLTGDFSLESFSSHTTSVKEDLSLEVKLGGTVGPETGYQIRPFSYWTESGVMVIDYAVNVDEAAQGYTPTWWQDTYGTMPDPALNLPWRLDPEKGYALNTDLKRYQTKDIVIYPTYPLPGDTILVYAKIHNYSLLPTPDPVKLSFYLGDPDEGGELIESNEGQTLLSTESAISPRDYQWVHMEWIMPESGRLFVVLDPENTMSEIHENNNKGWIALGPDDSTTGMEDFSKDNETPGSENAQLINYPNPFIDHTTISFFQKTDQHAMIRVKDLSGRDVFVRDIGYRTVGEHHIEFNGTHLPSGMYILNLEFESGVVATHKMIVM